MQFKDLSGEPLLMMDVSEPSPWHKSVTDAFLRSKIPCRLQEEKAPIETIKKMVAIGLGVGFVPLLCVREERARGELAVVDVAGFQAKDVKSPIGTVSILNANNGLTGVGATWDISQSVTGDQIPPRAQSHPFCFSFHVEIPVKRPSLEGADLLKLKVRVLASAGEHSEDEPKKNE